MSLTQKDRAALSDMLNKYGVNDILIALGEMGNARKEVRGNLWTRQLSKDVRTKVQNGLDQAIEAMGTATKLAKCLNISQQAVAQWKVVPSHHVVEVERITGIMREVLRPDLYPTNVFTDPRC